MDKVKDALLDIKRKIHDAAVYPQGVGGGVKPYITPKVVDAIINNKIEEIKNEREN